MQMRRQFHFNVEMNEEKKTKESNKAIDRSTNTHTERKTERERLSEKKEMAIFSNIRFVSSMCVCAFI